MTDQPRGRVQIDCGPVSRTHQSFKQDCDINVVMRRYANNGQLPQLNRAQPSYGDFSNATDYLTAQVTVMDAIADFGQLPARVRKACGNDPAQFLTMVQDPNRVQELVDLGLAIKRVPEQLQIPGTEPKADETPAKEGEEKPT